MNSDTSAQIHLESERASIAALIAIIVIFVTALVAGWQRLLLFIVPGGFAWIVAVAISAIGVVLAKAVAVERVLHKRETGRDKTWIAYFFVLFCLSSLGTMNTFFYWGERSFVLAEAIDKARSSLDQLQAIAASTLVDQKFNEKSAKINSLIVNLEGEIHNPRNCGEGREARSIIAELQRELPGFHKLSGTSSNCNGLDKVIKSYKSQAINLLQSSPEYIDGNMKQVNEVLSEIRARVEKENNALEVAKEWVNGTQPDRAPEKGDGFSGARQALESAATTYTDLRIKLEKVSGKSNGLPKEISVENARQLGSIAQLIPSLLGRLNRITTYIYIALAITMDVILIVVFMRVLSGASDLRSFTDLGHLKRNRDSFPKDIVFAWVHHGLQSPSHLPGQSK